MKNRFTTAAALAIAFVVGSGSLCAAAPVKMVVVLKTLSSQYWKIVASGAQDAAKKHNVTLTVLGPPTEDAVEQQINMVQDALAGKPDVLIFSPSQPATAVNVLMKAKEQHVPVILVDTGMPASFTDYVTFIGTDNTAAGKAGGKALAAVLKKGDKVLLLDGAPGNPSMTDRVNGAEAVLKAAGMIIASKQPAYSDREKAYTATQNVLQSSPDIKGVFSAAGRQEGPRHRRGREQRQPEGHAGGRPLRQHRPGQLRHGPARGRKGPGSPGRQDRGQAHRFRRDHDDQGQCPEDAGFPGFHQVVRPPA